MRLSLLLLALAPAIVLGKDCAKPSKGIMSKVEGDNQGFNMRIINSLPEDLELKWVNFDGEEVDSGDLQSAQTSDHTSFVGHVFRVYRPNGEMIDEWRLSADMEVKGALEKVLYPCGVSRASNALFSEGRDKEFEKLTHDQNAACVGDPSQWSCVRHVSKEEIAGRKNTEFGFQPEELLGKHLHSGRHKYQVKDDTYFQHIPLIPHLTPDSEGNGFLKMNMTKVMQDTLFKFFDDNYETPTMQQHEEISGYYSNNHHVHMDKIDLDKFPAIRRVIIREMHQIEQWWTMRKLSHTSTFGMRIYREGSMLINHVDRADTHLASAVLQVNQKCPPGTAWPLEVISTDGELYEVYLQPGEMVLYEGARLFHGRPKKSGCEMFANIFSHFAPVGFHGPHSVWDDKKSEVPGVTPRVVPAEK